MGSDVAVVVDDELTPDEGAAAFKEGQQFPIMGPDWVP
jgi:hypothetical protein